jgi:hypothetical protein
MMEKMVKAGTPGEHHKRLEMMAGTFDAGMTCFGPMQMPPSKGVTKNTMVLGGRWLQSEYAGDMMGQKFTGHGMMGYDNTGKKYQGTWIDSMGTQMTYFEGTADASGAITVTTEGIDPMTDQKMKMKMVYVIQDKDKHTFTMYMPGPDGKDAKMMEIVYTRAK